MEDSPDAPARVRPLPVEAIRAQKLEALARLAPGITHELNNPLAAIAGFAELLRTDPRLPDDMRRHAELLATEATTTRVIVQTLLEFVRSRPPERHVTSVRALLDAVLLLHGYRLASGQVAVEIDLPEDVPDVEVDRAGIQLVLVNLVHEATDGLATGGGARLRIGAARDGRTLSLTLASDRGNASAEPSPERERAWLVSSAIVADHGGTLARTSAGVSMELPLSAVTPGEREPFGEPEAARSAPPPAPRAPDAAARILILDDERSIGMLLERWLRSAGYEPTVASAGHEAVELVRTSSFDAVLCDHRMAGMAGTEVFDQIVAVRPELARRFIFMSGDVLNPDLRRVVDERGVGLLAKPFDRETVQATLESVLRA